MTSTKDPEAVRAAITAQARDIEAWLVTQGAHGSRDPSYIHELAEPNPSWNAEQVADHVVDVVGMAVELTDLSDGGGPELNRDALRIAVRILLDQLAAKAPGKSVEVRVPPYAAIQCVAGTTHTRGTPPSVVETDPVSWYRVATNRAKWADLVASGRVAASGERCDLSRYLPLRRVPLGFRRVIKRLLK